jgi:protein ImuA
MSTRPAIAELREKLGHLEETKRRFSQVVSIAEEVDRRLPFGGLAQGCIHEVKGASVVSALAFAAILSARIAQSEGNILYIAPGSGLHPSGLHPLGLLPYGVRLDRLVLISVRRPQDLSWAILEALRCSQVSVMMTLVSGLDLTDSRRLQLAAENSGTTGFLLNHSSSAPIAAPITRWLIRPRISQSQRFDEPAWNLDLLYCRGGIPASWILEWRDGHLRALSPVLQKFGIQNKQIGYEALAG